MYKVEWKRSGNKGRGVFALKNFKKGEVLEECPVIPLTAKESSICDQTILEYYVYPWRGKRDGAIVMGYGMLYNHSPEPNARYHLKYDRKRVIFKALRSIKKGEEILVNYNGDPKNKGDMDLFNFKERHEGL
ncbi:MAG: SET domain-containing protein [Candidatus Colwellbacteria bacterium]